MEPSGVAVEDFLATVANKGRREDAVVLVDLLRRVTGEEPVMWGPSIIGFGHYHYRYATGREGDAGAAGFSPRAAAMTVYLPEGVQAHAEELERLGPHTTGEVCLYLKRLSGIDLTVLERILQRSWETCSAPGFGQV